MKKEMAVLLAALAVLTICSCGKPVYYEEGESVFYPALNSTVEDSASQQSDGDETTDRKIIKKGEIQFETADINQTMSLIELTVRELNGYISKVNVGGYSNRIEHKLSIRVPAEKFDLLLKNISENVDKFDSKNIDVLDVTEEYIDVQSRVKTKKELQARYTELLKQATSIDEMLKIENEIGKLQTEIESVEGRIRYLNDRIVFSTLDVTYYQTITTDTPGFAFASEFKVGITTGWELFLWFIIGLSYFWVFIVIVVVAAAYLFVRRKKKMFRSEN